MAFSTGGDGGGSVSAASDVSLNTLQNDHVLTYDDDVGKWTNKANSAGGSVYVTTIGAALPEDLPDGTLIARYVQESVVTPTVTRVGSAVLTSPSSVISAVTTADIPAGDVVVVAVNRGMSTETQVAGSATVTLSGGSAGSWTRASSTREGTHDIALLSSLVAVTIPAGSTVTVTTPTNSTYRAVLIVAGVSGLSSAILNATSGDDATGVPHGTSAGSHGTGVSLTASTDTATTIRDVLVMGAFSASSTNAPSQAAGQTEVGYITTEAGSSDRGVVLNYKTVSSTGLQSMTVNYSNTGSHAAAVIALPIQA